MNPSFENNLISFVIKSRSIFFFFVNECNKSYRDGHDLDYYLTIIQTHRKMNNIEDLLDNEIFLNLLFDTLKKWNMDQRGAKLQSIDIIRKNILAHKAIFKELYGYKLHEINSLANSDGESVLSKLIFVFKHLNIMKSKRQIVGGSKALHFLLPDLVIPMDSEYTMNCFYGYNKYSDNIEAESKIFKDIFVKSHQIIKKLNLCYDDLDNQKWNTSLPKLIDNAMIGFLGYLKKYGSEKTITMIKAL